MTVVWLEVLSEELMVNLLALRLTNKLVLFPELLLTEARMDALTETDDMNGFHTDVTTEINDLKDWKTGATMHSVKMLLCSELSRSLKRRYS